MHRLLLLLLALTPSALATPLSHQEAEQVEADLGLSVEQLVSALPSCTFKPANGRLDLERGCADGLCLDMPTERAVQPPFACKASKRAQKPMCDDDAGRRFWDERESETRPQSTLGQVYLSPPYDGTSADGLGLGVSLACFLEVYGTPDQVEVKRAGSRFEIAEIRYDEPEIWLDARQGLVTKIAMHPSKTSRGQ